MHRILVVEDDPGMQKLLRERLEGAYEVVTAPCSRAALSLVLKVEPRCILLDLLMPGVTGFELCRTFSSFSLTKTLPVLVISGNSESQYRDFCLNLGARDYFQKPIDFERLRVRLKELTASQHYRSGVNAKLEVALELRGIDRDGNAFHAVTATDSVTSDGFRCSCAAPLTSQSVVEVHLLGFASKTRIGRAHVVSKEPSEGSSRKYGFEFVQKPHEWLV